MASKRRLREAEKKDNRGNSGIDYRARYYDELKQLKRHPHLDLEPCEICLAGAKARHEAVLALRVEGSDHDD